MRPEFLQRLADDLHLPPVGVESAVRTSHARVRRVLIHKRDGSIRFAYQPAAAVKPVLIWLRMQVLRHLPVSPIATAFREGASILKNAHAHRESRYSIRVDMENFFQSITGSDVVMTLSKYPPLGTAGLALPDILELVNLVCLDRSGRLPIGFSTSPDLANAVMFEIDTALTQAISDQSRYGKAVLTRYADDFVFSTDKKGACATFLDQIRHALSVSPSPRLRINEKKTRFMSRGGGSTLITGLRITNDAVVRVHSMYRDHVRLLLHHYKGGRLGLEEQAELLGHLAYIEHVDPQLYTKLSFTYFANIESLRKPP